MAAGCEFRNRVPDHDGHAGVGDPHGGKPVDEKHAHRDADGLLQDLRPGGVVREMHLRKLNDLDSPSLILIFIHQIME